MDHHYIKYASSLIADNLYLFVFIISVLESTPILGSLTPGMLLMMFFGATAFLNGISLGYVILFGFLGAVIGDILGYLLGKYAGGWMVKHKKLLKEVHIEFGRSFFSRHGGKSILIGRFVGIIRPIVPVIAGSIQMSFRKFLFWNVLGAFLWVTFYAGIGYFFGHYTYMVDKIISRASWVFFIIAIPLIYIAYKKYKKAVMKI